MQRRVQDRGHKSLSGPPAATAANEILEIVREFTQAELPHFSDALGQAFGSADPVFTRPKYGDFFWHCASTVPGWLGSVVLANAEAESHGSSKLMSLWQQVAQHSIVNEPLLKHADDESRHSRLFLELAHLAFEPQISRAETKRLDRELPDVRKARYSKAAERLTDLALMDHLAQMNLGEIRTRINVLLIAPVLHAFSPATHQPRVAGILTSLVRDEVRHISYTAQLLEEWARDGNTARLAALYRLRLRDLHLLTMGQTEASVRSFGAGRFPELLEICFCARLQACSGRAASADSCDVN